MWRNAEVSLMNASIGKQFRWIIDKITSSPHPAVLKQKLLLNYDSQEANLSLSSGQMLGPNIICRAEASHRLKGDARDSIRSTILYMRSLHVKEKKSMAAASEDDRNDE